MKTIFIFILLAGSFITNHVFGQKDFLPTHLPEGMQPLTKKALSTQESNTYRSPIKKPISWDVKDAITSAGRQIDNKGTEFWLVMQRNNDLVVSGLYLDITADDSTSGYVEISGINFYQEFIVKPDSISRVQIPDEAQLYFSEEIEQKGIHLVSDKEITVYGMSLREYSSDGFLGLPLDILSTRYMVMSYPNGTWYNFSTSKTTASQFAVVSPYDEVTVTITPSCLTANEKPAGEPFEIILNKGEAYQLQSFYDNDPKYDLTGSVIQSSLPVAVFSGSACASIPTDVSACDHIIEQLPPISTWGNEFIAHPLEGRENGDTWRMISASDSNIVSINDTIVDTLNFGDYYETILEHSAYIESDEPLMLMQFSNGDSYDPSLSNNGDPFMMLIPPVQQYMNNYTFATPDEGFSFHYLTIVVESEGAGSIEYDGEILPASIFTPIYNSGYSAVGLSIEQGTHHIQSNDYEFGIYSYGFDRYDSYGYTGGLSLNIINTNEGPIISRTKETIEYDRMAALDNVPINISCRIIDTIAPSLSKAYLYYKHVQESVYDTIPLTKSVSEKLWTAQIPADSVKYPGIQYYLYATDGQLNTTKPGVEAAKKPFNIAVLPNMPPEIMHVPVINAPFNDSILIQAIVRDATYAVDKVALHSRNAGGNPVFLEIEMYVKKDSLYEAYIPANYVTEQGTEYYIEAVDDLGLSAKFYSADNPVRINVTGNNNAPIMMDQQFTLAEDAGKGDTIGVIISQDVDTIQTMLYRVLDGNLNNVFFLDAFTGGLTVNEYEQLNYDEIPVYELTMVVYDNGEPTLTDTAVITVYIEDVVSIQHNRINKSEVKVYPNPTNGIVHIRARADQLENASITIYNMMGKKIKSIKYADRIDLSELDNGLYLLQFQSRNNNISKKITIQ